MNVLSFEINWVFMYIFWEYGDYDVSFVLLLKEMKEEGVVIMEYIVLMMSCREFFLKLILDLRFLKKLLLLGLFLIMSGVNRIVDLLENGEIE